MRRAAIISAIAMLLAACGAEQGSEYVGKWVNVRDGTSSMLIERNGEAFIIRQTRRSFLDGKPETNNIPATVKDGMLQASVGLAAIPLAIEKASGNLTDGRAEYKRVK